MKLLERMADEAARRHLAANTVKCDSRWVWEFLAFCRVDGRWREPGELRGAEVSAFPTHLAVERRSAQSTRDQAMNAILFLYRDVEQGDVETGTFWFPAKNEADRGSHCGRNVVGSGTGNQTVRSACAAAWTERPGVRGGWVGAGRRPPAAGLPSWSLL